MQYQIKFEETEFEFLGKLIVACSNGADSRDYQNELCEILLSVVSAHQHQDPFSFDQAARLIDFMVAVTLDVHGVAKAIGEDPDLIIRTTQRLIDQAYAQDAKFHQRMEFWYEERFPQSAQA